VTDVMLDLETMSTRPNACIVAIGAVEFSETEGLGKTFYEVVDLESSMRRGLHVEGNTIMWWLRQEEAARKAIGVASSDLPETLIRFTAFLKSIKGPGHLRVWANSCSFDNVILRSSYQACGMNQPFDGRADRCYRTMKDLCYDIKPVVTPGTTKHNALDDAVAQAEHLVAIWKSLTPQS